MSRVITLGALNRNESRGAHYKPDFPKRDDENFLKTTIAEFSGEGPVLSYEAVDISLLKPRVRDYSHNKQETTSATVAAGASASGLPPKEGAKQVPVGGEEQKPENLSAPVVWTQDKEKVNASEKDATRNERGKSIEDAGGKSDKV